jgi:hypothetical protein
MTNFCQSKATCHKWIPEKHRIASLCPKSILREFNGTLHMTYAEKLHQLYSLLPFRETLLSTAAYLPPGGHACIFSSMWVTLCKGPLPFCHPLMVQDIWKSPTQSLVHLAWPLWKERLHIHHCTENMWRKQGSKKPQSKSVQVFGYAVEYGNIQFSKIK